MNGIQEVTGSIPVRSTNYKSLILNGLNRQPTSLIEPPIIGDPLCSGLLNRYVSDRAVDGAAVRVGLKEHAWKLNPVPLSDAHQHASTLIP
jgi:hypothetical protein